jgi:hypothetical protein
MILSACEYARIYWLVYHVLLFATSSVLYCEGLSSTEEAYSLYFAVGKKGHKEKESIGKRDIVVNNIDIEKRERERLQLNTYVHMPANFFLSIPLSLFSFTFTKYTERTKLSVLNEMCVHHKIVDHFCCI